MKLSTKTFTLFFCLESIRISFTTAIEKCLTHLIVRIVIKSCDIIIARTRINGNITNRALRNSFNCWSKCDSNVWRCFRLNNLFLASFFAGFLILEAVLVTLTTTVFEFVTGICSVIVVVLFDKTATGPNNFGQTTSI